MMDYIADDEIWKRVREVNYSWLLGQNAIQKIGELIETIVPNNDYVNSIEGRKVIGHALRGPNKNAVATWIVKDWGGIRRGSNKTIQDWIFSLKEFDDNIVE